MASNIDFVETFKLRTKQFAIDVIKYSRTLPKSRETNIISNQLIRSSTSVASNYRAACRARSAKEFYAKLCTVVEEADESLFWLEIIEATIKSNELTTRLLSEATEIVSIAATARKSTGKKL